MHQLHTPGPLQYEADRGEANFGWIWQGGRWVARIQHNGEAMPARQEADGRLWAAAPDMHGALIEAAQAAEDAHAAALAEVPEGSCIPPWITRLQLAAERAHAALVKADERFKPIAANEACHDVSASAPAYTWRRTPAGALVMSNAEGADVANVYTVPSGKVCADPWGRERRHFEGPTAEADARAYVEAAFRR